MNKHKKVICIILLSVISALILLAALTYIPRTRALDYDMYGYIINRDGQIIEQFTFNITGKEYDFIIDPPGGEISFRGDTLENCRMMLSSCTLTGTRTRSQKTILLEAIPVIIIPRIPGM